MKNMGVPRVNRSARDVYMNSAGPVDFKSRISERPGDVMTIASRDVVTVPPTMTIIGAVKTMMKFGFRRLPIADAGTNRLSGIITSLDIVDFLGGGPRYNLVKNRFDGNIMAAVNASVKEIMEDNVVCLNEQDSLKDSLKIMMEKNVGGLPIIDGENRVKGIISERDFVWLMADNMTGSTVEDYMSRFVVTAVPDMTVGDATRTMVSRGFRRLPILKEGVLLGMVTASDVLRFMGSGDIFKKLVTGDAKEVFEVPIKTLITKEIIWSRQGIDIGEAAGVMVRKSVGALPVLEDSTLTGIITERDMVKALSESG